MAIDRSISAVQANVSGRWLVVSLLLSLMVLPLFEGLEAGRTLLLAGYSFTFVIAAIAARAKLRATAIVFLVVALPTSWATLFVDSSSLFVAHSLLGSAFFWIVGGLIVLRVIKTHAVNVDSIFGAISAYLLFGLAWALSYWAIFTVAPSAFLPNSVVEQLHTSRSADFSHFVYYSFVTMSTLGYGDITPQGRITRTLSWIQSVTGQFYVAVVIAWLVSALPRPNELRQASVTDR